MKVNRRHFLKGSGMAGLSLATIASFPTSIQKALAIPANNQTGTIRDVEHVVILMQENRSFDSYFGTMKGVRGFGDRFTIPQKNKYDGTKRTIWEQYNDSNESELVTSYHLDQTQGNAQRVSGTHHSWVDAQKAWSKGRMSHWAEHKMPQSMGYFTRQEIPFQFALAEAFTICDAYHCSLHGGTNTNRLFHWTGTNGVKFGETVVNNYNDSLEKESFDPFSYTTYPERLEKAGVSWIMYQNMPNNFTDNPLVGFRQYREANVTSGSPVYHSQEVNPAYDRKNPMHTGTPLYKGIANTLPNTIKENDESNGFLKAFKDDVLKNLLPQVSWIMAPAEYSEHPSPSSPVQGGWFIQQILDALTANPEVWSKTVFIVNFDENDGFFDHMPPPCPPSFDNVFDFSKQYGKTNLDKKDLEQEYYRHYDTVAMPVVDGNAFGPGPRVPMYIISPWSRGGWVNSQYFDHTSVLRFLEARFGVREDNISPFRREMFGDLTSAFDFRTPNNGKLPDLNGRIDKASADWLRDSQQSLQQVARPVISELPKQELGFRPSRALPYRLHTSAFIDGDNIGLMFANTGTQASIFHVYDKLDLDTPPRRYMVSADSQLEDIWKGNHNGDYDLWILSNNGYHRHFIGNVTSKYQAEIRVCYDIVKGNVYLEIINYIVEPLHFHISSMAYFDKSFKVSLAVPAKQKIKYQFELSQTGHWYDFSVIMDEDIKWFRRFAGRVETGRDSITDPAMGMI